ncbi:hypothetical protein BH09SUM1_BH09SUM1_27760 [soil metagenome]
MGMGLIMMMLAWALALATAYAGKLILERRRWTVCMVVAGLLCMVMPHGTALGVFTIVTLLRDDVKAAFSD